MAVRRSSDFEEMLEWHPEMILVSESPVTWHGFLNISNSQCVTRDTQCFRVRLKLIIPNYPSFSNSEVRFGKQIALLRKKGFSQKVKELTQTAQTVSLFLRQLQSVIVEYMQDANQNQIIDFESVNDLLRDLKTALQNSSDVKLSCDQNLRTIKFSLKDVSLVMQRCNNSEIPWKVVSSDLPDIPAFQAFENNITNLSVAMTKFIWQVELLEKAWKQLNEIDKNCWVVDPIKPTKNHMYRRIHLSQSISVTITINPLNPTALPEIKFLGSDNEVKKQTDNVSHNIHNWNENCSILENLMMLLDMQEFPAQQEISLKDEKAIIGSHECGICFSADELPDKICNNEKCMKHFHSTCLSKWLQTNAGNHVVFGTIHGKCPHCKENISCPVG
ncbi:E3 ubiquitin-protein ligase FANCL isoform X3 [Pseudomyrmex gracilis]|nr:E3 ubiquitin-protein ligase FANCL isoform X3 [Pseudomyrmex gracilis]XP_020299831.1 E3 ubiquitin-protein ligase FANCL isoform X3 [Pseudomyrmex gracilis]XP_020299832.1 E3 ubiquitin-protein ligase FANCL isoform X3 [Pseudomyrmex gracilis]XP_020299833.1 E3 ubiquitin-protein ligase FANCL isoform X3 [Pseudomyrmex gracilis]